MDAQHLPVLVREALDYLAPERGGLFVDVTLGLGGHAEALLQRSPEARLLGIDRDPQALEQAARRLAPFGDRVRLAHATFDDLEGVLAGQQLPRVAGVLADLGVSSLQLDRPERGFSFRFDGPLDMRMGLTDLTAADVVNRYSEGDLEQIFREYGEERHARRIARAISRARAEKPLSTTGELKRIIDRAKPRGGHEREGRVDPATRVFQALRIAVNEELAGLETFLDQAVKALDADGRLVVISYHSLEDRIVKNTFRDFALGEVDPVTGRPRAESQLIEVLTRKPVRPTEEEVAFNPRSRSAKLRAARRL
ncbi:MAG TPA: 16S rRNA (cytosine(1402)-N(4))-methyltransferase RsmH [Candidatus Nanopelagicales bacterium]|nr:16S rRNA (cytosine(1402)-N(4))-methyltransferase RsmH [Candidatus Nanopelagicales bacterium]